jgi:excisionase family DNA binding protein
VAEGRARRVAGFTETSYHPVMNTTTEAKPLRAGEVATLFRVDPKTVGRWVKQGKLAYFRTLGGHLRFHPEDIEAALRRMG